MIFFYAYVHRYLPLYELNTIDSSMVMFIWSDEFFLILEYYYKYTMLYFQLDLVQRENKACLEFPVVQDPVENII